MSTKTTTTVLDRAFFIPDTHHDTVNQPLLDNMEAAMVDDRPTLVIQGGDMANWDKFGRYPKDPRKKESLMEILSQIRGCFARWRRLCPEARIIFKEGNHDKRIYKYVRDNAPGLIELEELSIPYLYGLKAAGVEFFREEDRLILPGGLKVTHGTRYSTAGPAYTALAELRYAEHDICGGVSFHIHDVAHVHQRGQFWMVPGFMGSMNVSDYEYLGDSASRMTAGFGYGRRIRVETRDSRGRFLGTHNYWQTDVIRAFGPNHDKFFLNGKLYG